METNSSSRRLRRATRRKGLWGHGSTAVVAFVAGILCTLAVMKSPVGGMFVGNRGNVPAQNATAPASSSPTQESIPALLPAGPDTVVSQQTASRVPLNSVGVRQGATTLPEAHVSSAPGQALIPSSDDASSATAPSAPEEPPLMSGESNAAKALTTGNSLYDQKLWRDAIVQYRKAIDGGIDNPDVRTDLGNCYRMTGDFQGALDQYHIAQKANPLHEESLFNTATLFMEGYNDPARAAQVWREYMKRFPTGQHVADARRFFAESGISTSGTSAAAPVEQSAAPATSDASSPQAGAPKQAELMNWLNKQQPAK